jgi:hypothetical protein
MSTRAQIAVQTGPDEWSHVYVHFDGYPEHMLAALKQWQPADILAARELRSVSVDRLEAYDPPRPPQIEPVPTRTFEYLYGWREGAWAVISEQSWPR